MRRGTWAGIRRLGTLAYGTYPKASAFCLLLVGASAGANLALVWSVRRLVDSGPLPATSLQGTFGRAAIVFLLMLLMAAADAGVAYVGMALAERVTAGLRSKMLASFIATDYRRMIRHHRGEVSTWLINDLDQVKGGLVRLVTNAVRDPIVTLLLLGSIVALDPFLACLVVAVAAVLFLPLLFLGRRIRRLNRGMLDDLGRVMSFHTDALGALRTLKGCVAEAGVASAYARRNDDLRRSFLRVVWWGSLSGPTVTLGTGALLLTVLTVGWLRMGAGHLTTGTLVALISSLLLFARPAAALAGTWNGLQAALGGATRVFAVLDLTPEPQSGATGLVFGKSLALDHAWFSYDDKAFVLEDVCLEVPRGGSVAIVGPNGAGKSTLVGLLIGLLTPSQGAVRLDGRSVSELNPAEYRRLFALVSAEPELFAESVFANVALWDARIKVEDVVAALQSVGMGDWLANLRDGVDTRIGPGQVELSRGQRQKLSLARALVRRSKVLVLDEATESLDPLTVALLDEAAASWLGEFTVILITHRVTLLERFDSVVVLREGRVVEEGSHKDLREAGGLYNELYELRLRHEREARLV